MGGLAGGLYAIFELLGRLFFFALIGKRAERPSMRASSVMFGAIIFGAVGGLAVALLQKPVLEDMSPVEVRTVYAAVGGVAVFLLAMILHAYVRHVEDEEETMLREKIRREERIAKGLDPDKHCFVATAVFGPDAPETACLRAWRDRRLCLSSTGRRIVSAYYAIAPTVASLLKRSELLKSATRVLLRTVVRYVGHH